MAKKEDPKEIGDVVARVLRELGVGRVTSELKVFEVWEEALGETLAKNLRPVAFMQGVVVAAVPDSAWLQEMHFLKDEVKRKLNRAMGGSVVRDVRFKLGAARDTAEAEDAPSPWRRGDSDSGGEEIELPEEVVKMAESAVASIPDRKLKEQVRRALLATARRNLREGEEI